MDENNRRPDVSALRIDKSKKFIDRPRSRAWRWLVALIAIVVLVVGYFALKSSLSPATNVRVATATIIRGSDAAADLVATGYVVAQRMAEVSSKATGRLAALNYEEGDTVAQGAVIARLDNSDFVALVQQAEAAVNRAVVDTLESARDFRRAKELFKSGAITDVELENAETAYKSAAAALAGAEAALKVAQVDLDNTYIRAPFAGTILMKNAEVGEMVTPFASAASSKGSVVTMADMNSLEVEADVSESNIYRVYTGQRAEIVLDAYPGVRYGGYVKKIVPTADRARATVLTRVAFKNKDDRVLPEMSARVNFFSDTSSAADGQAESLTVPTDAVTSRDGSKTVFVVTGAVATATPVETGTNVGGRVEILSGLSEGDTVVLSPPGKMKSGDKVEVAR